ncbi:MAG: hypothetical protein ACRDTA_20380 [Pseudonocardiaceae bacterium]
MLGNVLRMEQFNAAGIGEGDPVGRTDHCFEFAVDPRFRWLLARLGVREGTSGVWIGPHGLVARFGLWVLRTPLDNIADVTVTGPFRAWRVIGPRLSLADRGLTFGSNTALGACIRFRHPVPGLDPLGLLRHPALTVTVRDPDALARQLRRYLDSAD